MKRARVVSKQNKSSAKACRTHKLFHGGVHSSTKHAALFPNSTLSPPLSTASCYLAPSGGSLWPPVSPVFSHCWFRPGATVLPLTRVMSSRLLLIIAPQLKEKPARRAGFSNASCRGSLVSCLTSGKSLQNKTRITS